MGNYPLWLVLPAVLALAFGIWVFYDMLLDVSEREIFDDVRTICVEGCQRPQFEPGSTG